MNTPDHAFWTFALFHRKDWWTKAVVASMLPDVPFFISSVYFFLMYGMSMDVWVQAFESSWVKPFGFFSHSLVVAIPGLAIAFSLGKSKLYPYFYGWLVHIFTDIFTHVSDAQPVLWPLSDRRFPGLVSYWEPSYHGHEFTIVNLALQSLLAVYFFLAIRADFQKTYPVARTILFGFLCVYSLGSGLLFFLYGYVSTLALVLHFVAGVLFLSTAITVYDSKRRHEE